ncbi:MAG: hypothetical protein QXU32_06445 [Nitrososphaerales archaeon]
MRRDKAAKIGRKRRRGKLITIGIMVAIAIGVGVAVYSYIQTPPRTAGFGAVGSAHEHAAFKLFINNQEPVDFSLPQYQVKSRYIHFEDANGVILHRHATGVDIGFLFESLGMKFTNQCITLGNGTSYCNDGDKTVKLFVNGVRNEMYDKYVLQDGDKILLTYGNENMDQIGAQLRTLDLLTVPTQQP